MFKFNRVANAALLSVGLISLGACAGTIKAGRLDPYVGTRYGYVVVGKQPLTKEIVEYTDKYIVPRCEQYAKETTPDAWKMASAYGINHFVAGGLGSAGGYVLEGGIVGAVVKGQSALAVGVYGGTQSAANAAMSAMESHDAQVHNTTRGCMAADAGGYHYVPPSEGQKIKSGKQGPTSYGRQQQVVRDPNPGGN